MCIIMSLNVNEMELKDPTQRTCGLLWKKRKRRGWKKKRKSETKKKEKCQDYQGYVHLWEHKHLISWPTCDNELEHPHIYKPATASYKTTETATGTQIKRGQDGGSDLVGRSWCCLKSRRQLSWLWVGVCMCMCASVCVCICVYSCIWSLTRASIIPLQLLNKAVWASGSSWPPALLSETLSWILMAWPETHAIKLGRPFLSVLSLPLYRN